jgi:glycosyltransferase involved in cell wall biosynthesis
MNTMGPTIIFLQTNPGRANGISSYIRQITTKLQGKYNCQVTAFCPETDRNELAMYYAIPPHNLLLLPAGAERKVGFTFLKNLAHEIKRRQANVVHAHALRAGFLFALLKVGFGIKTPSVYTNHGLRYRQLVNPFRKLFVFLAECFTTRLHQAVVSITAGDQRRVDRYLSIMAPQGVWIRTRVDVEVSSLRSVDPSLRIIGVGPPSIEKGTDRFIEIARLVNAIRPDVSFTWVGSGPELPVFSKASSNLNAGITWMGQLDRTAVLSTMKESFLYLFCSRIDTYPMAVLEAYACGLPVIFATDYECDDYRAAGMPRFQSRQLDLVAKTIYEILTSPELHAKLSRAAIEWYSMYGAGARRFVRDYDRLYDSLCHATQ